VSGLDTDYHSLPDPVRDFFDDQFQRAYQLVSDLRYEPTGLYRDAYLTTGQHDRISSIAATGAGLIALAIADMEGFEHNAAEKAIITLRSILGYTGGCAPIRDAGTGFFCHWIDVLTGERRWNSEISTIDTALLVSGALFAMNYFASRELTRLVIELYSSIAWHAAVADPGRGAVFLVIEDGKGRLPVLPFNEYAILANLIRYEQSSSNAGSVMWRNVFQDSALPRLPAKRTPFGHILCMHGRIPSSFVYQFPFYLVHEYTTGSVYRCFYRRMALADRISWKCYPDIPDYLWGHGAGVNSRGYYHADAVGDNPTRTAAPYIIAGFLPVYQEGIYDLYEIYRSLVPYNRDVSTGNPVDDMRFCSSYRYGLTRIELPVGGKLWYPEHMSAIDWSTMLYGLTAFKHGVEFFVKYNDFSSLGVMWRRGRALKIG